MFYRWRITQCMANEHPMYMSNGQICEQKSFLEYHETKFTPGELWWIPAEYTDEVEKWEQLVTSVGGEACLIPIYNDEATVVTGSEYG